MAEFVIEAPTEDGNSTVVNSRWAGHQLKNVELGQNTDSSVLMVRLKFLPEKCEVLLCFSVFELGLGVVALPTGGWTGVG